MTTSLSVNERNHRKGMEYSTTNPRRSVIMLNWKDSIQKLRDGVISMDREIQEKGGHAEGVGSVIGTIAELEWMLSSLSEHPAALQIVLGRSTETAEEGSAPKSFEDWVPSLVKRQQYPKTFSILEHHGQPCLVEKIEGSTQSPLYCLADFYDHIATAVANLSKSGTDFDRFILLAAAKEICPTVTLPAVICCIRFWMSVEEPLLEKDFTKKMSDGKSYPFRITVLEDTFVEDATVAWSEVEEEPIHLEHPRSIGPLAEK
jgi:hypothetical protein